MDSITKRIQLLEDNDGAMTEEELFEAYSDILRDEDLDVDDIDRIGLFVVPVEDHDDRYGRTQYVERYDKIKLSSYAKRIFTEEHQKALLSLAKEFIEDGVDEF